MENSKPTRPRIGLVRSTVPRTRIATALIGIALALVAGLLATRQAGRSLELLSYDIPFIMPQGGASDDIVIVYIDRLKGEAVDRTVQEPLLDALGKAGAKTVVYDLIFEEELPEVDPGFAAAMRRFRGVDESGDPIPGKPQRSIFLACGRGATNLTGAAREVLSFPNDQLLEAAGDNFGSVAYDDQDYMARKLTTGTRDEPSLTWNAAIALGAPLAEDSRKNPRWLYYSRPPFDPEDQNATPAFVSLPADSVQLDDFNQSLVRDKVVVIGGQPGIVGAGLGNDLFSTPFHRLPAGGKHPYLSGPALQATMLENLLHGNWLTRSNEKWDLPIVALAALVFGTLFTLVRPGKGMLLAIILVGVMIGAGFWLVHGHHTWVPWTIPAFVQLPIAVVWGIGARFYLEEFRRLQLNFAINKVVPRRMLRRLKEDNYEGKRGGEMTTAALMFTDLEDFTTMCEGIGKPDEILDRLNDYFETATRHVFDHEGAVVQYVGDAIYAAWGAPLKVEEAPLQAARAAWALSQDAHFSISTGHQDGKAEPSGRNDKRSFTLRTRIGLHLGEVVAGIVGSTRHISYSLMGDATNFAARLEGLNKLFGTTILLSEPIADLVSDEFHLRRVGKVQVKGKHAYTLVYELVGPVADGPPPAWIAKYHDALRALEENDIPRARELFETVKSQRVASQQEPGDGPSQFILEHLDSVQEVRDGVIKLNVK